METAAQGTSDEFLGEYTKCTDLNSKEKISRYMRSDFGSMNVSPNGYPNKSGALDKGVFCTFQNQQFCTGPAKSKDIQVEVRKQALQRQLHHSFRSVERATMKNMKRRRDSQYAHCEKMLRSSVP